VGCIYSNMALSSTNATGGPIAPTAVRKVESMGSGRNRPGYSLMISTVPAATATSRRRSRGSLVNTTSPRLADPTTVRKEGLSPNLSTRFRRSPDRSEFLHPSGTPVHPTSARFRGRFVGVTAQGRSPRSGGPSRYRRSAGLFVERTTGFEPATPTLAKFGTTDEVPAETPEDEL